MLFDWWLEHVTPLLQGVTNTFGFLMLGAEFEPAWMIEAIEPL